MKTTFLRGLACTGVLALLLAGCGGSGGGSNNSGSGSGSGSSSGATAQNVATIVVDAFPPYGSDICGGSAGVGCAALNQLYATLKICAAGSTTNCQTVDHVAIDTGSIGLRLLAASLSPPTSTYMGSANGVLASLPMISYTSAGGAGAPVNGTLAECAQFGGGYSWGSIRMVDVTWVGTNETAHNVPMQVMGDLGAAPAACIAQAQGHAPLTGTTNGVANPWTYENLGSNGLVGISLFAPDCVSCSTNPQPAQGSFAQALAYVVCTSTDGSACTPTTVSWAQQTINPITAQAADNNGYIIQMPAVGAQGGTTVTGSLILGIGTQPNNQLGTTPKKYLANPSEQPGFIDTTYNGVQNSYALFDTGSSLYFFNDSSIALCGAAGTPQASFYCPGGATTPYTGSTTLNLSAVVNDYVPDAAPTATVAFAVTNPNTLTSNTATAYNNVGGPGPATLGYFIWGMPTFYGKTIYFGIQPSPNSSVAPYYAF